MEQGFCSRQGLVSRLSLYFLFMDTFCCTDIYIYVPLYVDIIEPPMGKPTICIGENKDADQLRGNREADQRLCFRYSDSTIPLLLKSEISSF